jgi:hypothetical protein
MIASSNTGKDAITQKYLGVDKLGDTDNPLVYQTSQTVNALPFLAYQKIYYDFFSNSQWEKHLAYAYNVDYWSGTGTISLVRDMVELRYANYPKDYFMGMLPSSQYGSVAILPSLNPAYSPSNIIAAGSSSQTRLANTNITIIRITKNLLHLIRSKSSILFGIKHSSTSLSHGSKSRTNIRKVRTKRLQTRSRRSRSSSTTGGGRPRTSHSSRTLDKRIQTARNHSIRGIISIIHSPHFFLPVTLNLSLLSIKCIILTINIDTSLIRLILRRSSI